MHRADEMIESPRVTVRRPVGSRRASGLGPRCRPAGAAMEPYHQASVLRTCRGFEADRGLRVPCQNSISGSRSLLLRPCCRPLGMPLRKVAVAVTAVVVTVVVVTAEVMVVRIS